MRRSLWAACIQAAMDAGGGAQVRLVKKKVTSLSQLDAEDGPYTAVIAAAGAANELIAEIGEPPESGCKRPSKAALRCSYDKVQWRSQAAKQILVCFA